MAFYVEDPPLPDLRDKSAVLLKKAEWMPAADLTRGDFYHGGNCLMIVDRVVRQGDELLVISTKGNYRMYAPDDLVAVVSRGQTEAPIKKKKKPVRRRAAVAPPNNAAFHAWFSGSKVTDKEGNPLRCYHGTKSSIDFDEFSVDGPPYLDDEEGSSSSGSGADPTAFLGAHFAQETSVADQFATGTGWQKSRFDGHNERPRVIPVFLSIKNPKVFSTEDALHEFICEGTISGHEEELLYSAMQADGIDDPYDDESDEVQEWNRSYDNDVEFRVNQNLYLFLNYSPVEGEDEMLVEAAAALAWGARNRLQQQGFDGVRYKNKIEGGISWIAFAPNQVKSAFAKEFNPEDHRFTASAKTGAWTPEGRRGELGMRQDNPDLRREHGAKEWLQSHPNATTAWYDSVDISPAELVKLPGARQEHEHPDEKLVGTLAESMREKGFLKGFDILVVVEQNGQPFIYEGNHRTRAALKAGIPVIPVTVRYFGGSEMIPGVWDPANDPEVTKTAATWTKHKQLPLLHGNLPWNLPSFEEFLEREGGVLELLSSMGDAIQTYTDRYECDNPDGEPDETDILRYAEADLRERYYSVVSAYESQSFPMEVFREVGLKGGIESLRIGGIGYCWAWDERLAEAHCSEGGERFMLRARIPATAVDWGMTLFLNLDPVLGEEEAEVRLVKGVPIELTGWRKSKERQWQEPPAAWKRITASVESNESLTNLLEPLAGGWTGPEKEKKLSGDVSVFIDSNGSYRFVKFIDGQPVAAAQLLSKNRKTAYVSNMYVVPQYRRSGYGSELMKYARQIFKGGLTFSTDRSDQGEAFVQSQIKMASGDPFAKWLGVDLDGTLAESLEDYSDPTIIGAPIPLMVERIKKALAEGIPVKVMTARMYDKENAAAIQKAIGDWTEKHIGTRLEATNEKTPGMIEVWDDKARRVEEGTGKFAAQQFPSLQQVLDRTSDTIDDEAYDSEELKDDEGFYKEALAFCGALSFPLTVYRALALSKGQRVDRQNFGVCWSLDREVAISVAQDVHDGAEDYQVFEGTVAEDAVNWVGTIRAAMAHPDEQEVRLKVGASVQVTGPKRMRVTAGLSSKTAINLDNDQSIIDPQTDTPAFKAWFAGSKITDTHGRPLRVFHGTFNDFDKFDTDHGATEGAAFFTPDPAIASFFADRYEFGDDDRAREQGGGGRVIPVYLCLKNPMVVHAKDVMHPGEYGEESVAYHSFDLMRAAVQKARDGGYDGLHILDVPDGPGRSDQFAAFRPNQIKSAIGNNGEFNKRKHRMTAQGQYQDMRPDGANDFFEEPENPHSERPLNASATKLASQIGPVYHGTKVLFEQFQDSPITWFANDKDWVGSWGGRTVTAYITLTNPYIYEDCGYHMAELDDKRVVKQLAKQGYDGIIVKNAGEELVTYAVFYPSQIKIVPDAKTASFDKTALNIPKLVADFGRKLVTRFVSESQHSVPRAVTPETLIESLSAFDPTPNKEYTAWMTRVYANGGLGTLLDATDAMPQLLARFNELKRSRILPVDERDINKLRDAKALKSLTEKYADVDTTSNNKKTVNRERELIKSGAAEVFYNDAKFKIIIPHTEEAAKYFGINTKWCTAGEKDNAFAGYNEDGPLYMILDKANNRRFQFHFQSVQFKDETNKKIDPYRFFSSYPLLAQLFLPIGTATIRDDLGKGDVDCEECDGSGTADCARCDGSSTISCHECGGEGRTDDCEGCHGSGRVDCSECEGNGSVPDGEDEDGEELLKGCTNCAGDGWVCCEDCDGDGMGECENCGGGGGVGCPNCDEGQGECSNCSGSGINPDLTEFLSGAKRVLKQAESSKTAAPRGIWYHGSKTKNLQSILSQGLIPEVKEKNWNDDDNVSIVKPSRESYGGTYVTTNLLTAMGAPRDSGYYGPGTMVLVALELQPNTFYLDEDNINSELNNALTHLSDPSWHVPACYIAMTHPDAPGYWKEELEKFKVAYIEACLKQWHFRQEYKNKESIHPGLEKRIRELLPATWEAAITRLAAHAVAKMKDYDVARAYRDVFSDVEWDAIPPKERLFPTIAEGEKAFRDASEQMTRSMRIIARPEEGGFQNTARITTPIGYHGSNHIIAVAEIQQGRQFRGEDTIHTPVPIIMHYGKLPEDFFKQWKERQGSQIDLRRAKQSFKAAFLRTARPTDAKIKLLKDQFKLSDEQVEQVIACDPSPNQTEYITWLGNQLKKKWIRLPEDTNKLKGALAEFTKLKRSPTFTGEKDIQRYGSGDLYEIVTKHGKEVSKKEQDRQLLERGALGAELVVNEGPYKIFRVSDADYAGVLGSNTHWCTAADPETAAQYIETDPLYICYYQGKPYAQMHEHSQQFMDVNDMSLCNSKDRDPVTLWFLEALVPFTEFAQFDLDFVASRSTGTSPQELERMAFESENSRLLTNVAKNPSTPPGALTYLADDKSLGVREGIALNHKAPEAALRTIYNSPGVRHSDGDLKSYIADNRNCPTDILAELAKSYDTLVRKRVAQNPRTPENVLLSLASDPKPDVYYAIFHNPNLSANLLTQLAKAKNPLVRSTVAGCELTPVEVLVELSHDDDEPVRNSVARNAKTPANILADFAATGDRAIKTRVAWNPNLPLDSLINLSRDEDRGVREGVAKNTVTPTTLLVVLAKDKDENVRSWVMENKNTTPEILATMVDDPAKFIRYGLAKAAQVTPEILDVLANDGDRSVRDKVVSNKRTTIATLKRMVQNAADIFEERESIERELRKRERQLAEAA